MIEILIEFRAVFTAILVSLIAIYGAFALQRYLAIRTVVNDFKAEFATEIANIRNNDAKLGTFIDAFQKHKLAVDTVMPFLPKRHQRKLQKAWDDYCGKGSGIDTENFIAGGSNHPEIYPEFKKRFYTLHSCLNNLL